MKSVTTACGILVVTCALACFSQVQNEGGRQHERDRWNVILAQERGRGEQRRDSGMRRFRETPDRMAKPAREDYRSVFDRVQQGMKTGNVGTFSQHFGSQVLFNLRGGESGYYSSNQAYYLLENYLKSRKPVYFDFSTIGESETNPYATGSAGFNVKGSREVAQIYVSLSWVGERWVISQINIY